MRNLAQISGNLTQILEVADHPCRYHAAELLLRVQDHDLGASGSVEGLPQFEESLEKAILDPLSSHLETYWTEAGKM